MGIVYQPQTTIRYTPPTNIHYDGAKNLTKLSPGAGLSQGESLVSPNGKYVFTLQSDGNIVLYNKDHHPLWDGATQGKGGVRLVMQDDGNLVLYMPDLVSSVWDSASQGHPGAFFQMQDDGNAVLYDTNNSPLWETRTWGGTYHGESHNWLADAVATVGRPFAEVAHIAAGAYRGVAELASKVPIIGPALHGILLIASGPFTFTDSIIQGERLDRALINDVRDKLTGIREVGPYAKTILTLTGVGAPLSMAIGAGLAIAQGAPLDEAFVEGIASAVPGGDAGKALFQVTYAAATGQNVIQAAGEQGINALGLDPASTEGLKKGLNVVYKAAQGENIPLTALKEARSYVPKDALPAFDTAVAVAQGKRLQDAATSELANLSPEQLGKLASVGQGVIASSPALQAGQSFISHVGHGMADTAGQGYQIGMGLMRHAGTNEQVVGLVRNQLADTEQKSFDAAIATYKGAVQNSPPSSTATPGETAGYYLGRGLTDNPNPQVKQEALKLYLVSPDAKVGIGKAIAVAQSKQESFLGWLWRKLTFR